MVKILPSAEDVLFRGRKITKDLKEQISTMTLDMGVDQVTELSIGIEDPLFETLKTGLFDLETPVTYRGLSLIVAVVETSNGGGLGGITVRCRPKFVQDLKKRRGVKVMRKVSPSTFVASECKEVNANSVVEKSSVRGSISRDIVKKGDSYDLASYPSSWTTFRRLADELGFVMYEVQGTIYFAKPTYIVATKPKVQVQWYSQDGNEPLTIPQFRHSIDDTDVEVTVELPLDRAEECVPGYGIVFNGFPKFSGTYMITQVNYPLVGSGTVSVTASTVKNPEPQKSGDTGSVDRPDSIFDGLVRGVPSAADKARLDYEAKKRDAANAKRYREKNG